MRLPKLSLIVIIMGCLFLLSCSQNTKSNPKKDITVSAAASLSDAVGDIAKAFRKESGIRVHLNLAASGTLEHQIEQGAPVDLFLSASDHYMDELVQKGKVDKTGIKRLLTNQLVLIVPRQSQKPLHTFKDLTNKSAERIAIGTPATVPAGHYAKETLTALDLWKKVKPKLIFAKDVRQVLADVETGNVAAGIVYQSDAMLTKRVKVIDTAPPSSHEPIVYPMAVMKGTQHPKASQRFLDFLQSKQALKIFKKYGFQPIKSAPSQ